MAKQQGWKYNKKYNYFSIIIFFLFSITEIENFDMIYVKHLRLASQIFYFPFNTAI